MSEDLTSARRLKEHLKRIGQIKAILADDEALSLEARLERAVRHSQAHLDAYAPRLDLHDDALETWLRVKAHLTRLRTRDER